MNARLAAAGISDTGQSCIVQPVAQSPVNVLGSLDLGQLGSRSPKYGVESALAPLCDRLSHAVLRAHDGAPVRLIQHCAAVRAAEAGNERRSGRWPDLCVGAKGGEHRRQRGRMGVLEVERLQDEPAWC